MSDPIYEDPRWVQLDDPLDPHRSDLDPYADIVDEFEALSLLDVGCGTGTFACLLALRGLRVVAVDPARASLELARQKGGADQVQWIHGDATTLPSLQVDMATMTGNVAQVFLTDESFLEVLTGIRNALKPGGRLVFESRDPAKQAWREWNPTKSRARTEVSGVGLVESWVELVGVEGDLVSFRWQVRFETDGTWLTSHSTLRFRSKDEIVESLRSSNFVLEAVRDASDRPGLEWVFIARVDR